MQSDIRKSFKAIASALQVAENTVRYRVERLVESGFLRGWTLVVNPRLLGLIMGVMWFETPARPKGEMVTKLGMLPDMVTIVDYVGDHVVMVVLVEDEASLKRENSLVKNISEARNLVSTTYEFPGCDLLMSETDWEIISSIHENPRKEYVAVADDLGISTRTVKRRLGRMVEANAVFSLPSMDPAKLHGVVLADIFVSYVRPESKADVDRRIATHLGDNLILPEANIAPYGAFHLWLDNVVSARGIQNWVEHLHGVKTVRVDLVQARIERYDTMKDAVRRISRSRQS